MRIGERGRLLLLSFLMLFVELSLIRWTAAYVAYLAYFTNFLLLASFLGIGVGFIRANRGGDLFARAPVALAAMIGLVALVPVEVERTPTAAEFTGPFGLGPPPAWVLLPLLFAGAFLVMVAIAGGVARSFRKFPPLEAYRLDILGSVGGIVAFSVLSFLGAPPPAWGVVAAACFLVLLGRPIPRPAALATVAFVSILAVQSMVGGDRWSPYHRVSRSAPRDPGTIGISANGLPHQIIASVEQLKRNHPFYFVPYQRLVAPPHRVLIVGSGTGNDVAAALASGAGHVDAVEIDPLLYRIGRQIHPDRPYSNPRVTVHINDGRAFLHDTERRYDLVVFGLPQSVALVPGQSSLRLESYLFTEEAVRAVRSRLEPGGAFSILKGYGKPVVDRLARTLELVFERKPCIDVTRSSRPREDVVLTAGPDPRAVRCGGVWRPIGAPPGEPATDDHPFPYLSGRGLPGFYVWTLLLILAASAFAVRRVAGPIRPMAGYLDLFFMGAAFLLLETKSIVQFALLFGTTWFVNALVFTGVLVAVLAGIEVARRMRIRRPELLYAGLIASVLVAWAVPIEPLLGLPPVLRFGAATGLAFTPILLANVVFANRFKDVGSSTVAFGANLLGAMVGGVLEYTALALGYRSLLIVVAVLYALAFVAGRRHLSSANAGSPMPAKATS